MKNFYLTILLVTITFFSFSQNIPLTGRVLDTDNFPLPGATVRTLVSKQAVVTDIDGYFVVPAAFSNEEIFVSYVGFESQTKKVNQDNISKNYLEFNLIPMTNELSEVVVSGYQAGINKAMNKQRTDLNISNIISADQVGKFPDSNIGDALKRVPGISMQNDQGEARNIIIRGFSPELNSVMLNGERIPSAEGDNRRVQMDLIPSDMIQSIEVNKSLTPDMEADAIGGSVNLITRSNPNRFRFSVTGNYGYNAIRGGYTGQGSLIVADKLTDKLSYTFSSSLYTNNYGSDNIEFVWNNPDDWSTDSPFDEHDIRRYDVKRTRRSASLNLDYKINNNHRFYLKSMLNSRDDWENRFRVRIAKIDVENNTARIRKQTKGGIDNEDNKNRRLESQSTNKFSIGGKHQFNQLSMDWKVSTSKAQERRPEERYIRYELKKTSIAPVDISNPSFPVILPLGDEWNTPSSFKFNEATNQNGLTYETDNSFKLDFKLPYGNSNNLKFGFKFKAKEKLRDNDFYDFSSVFEDQYPTLNTVGTIDATIDGYLPGDSYKHGYFVDPKFLGSLNMPNGQGELLLGEFITGNYNASENVTATYGMFTQNLGSKTTMIAGARLEATSVDYQGYSYQDSDVSLNEVERLTGSNSYTNILPNLTFQSKLSDDFIVNLALTSSLSRPNYFNLVPYRSILIDDEEISEGNSELKATVSNNIDLSLEKYFGGIGLVSASFFNKNLNNWFYKFTTTDYAYNGANNWTYSQLRNGSKATVTGLEISVQTPLTFLPGFLENLTIYSNYTFTNSKAGGIEGREDLPLVGAVRNMFNGSLAYESKRLFLRASLNYSGPALDEIGGASWEDRWYDKQMFLDINGSYELRKSLRLFVEMKNLTNQPLRYYQGISERTMQLEYYNYSANIGLKLDL